MNWYKEKISKVKPNPNNPRIIKDDKFEKLVRSIKEFPKMLEIRPIVVNDDMIVLGGNMRLKACKEAGLNEVPIIKASYLTEDEQKQFIIKDNVSGGEWDWDKLANEWQSDALNDWGLNVWVSYEEEKGFDFNENEDYEEEKNPQASDDNYSSFQIIMLHENKKKLIELLEEIKGQNLFDKQEDALMLMVKNYKKK